LRIVRVPGFARVTFRGWRARTGGGTATGGRGLDRSRDDDVLGTAGCDGLDTGDGDGLGTGDGDGLDRSSDDDADTGAGVVGGGGAGIGTGTGDAAGVGGAVDCRRG
jgi:hypothetical protein